MHVGAARHDDYLAQPIATEDSRSRRSNNDVRLMAPPEPSSQTKRRLGVRMFRHGAATVHGKPQLEAGTAADICDRSRVDGDQRSNSSSC